MILITGADGFVGRRLADVVSLQFPDQKLRLFDVRRIATPPAGAETLCGSIECKEDVDAAVRGADTIVHLAAFVNPESRDAEKMQRTNTNGTRVLYGSAVDAGCRLFVHISSAGIYGYPRAGLNPYREEDPARPVSPYQRTKWEAEQALRSVDAKGTTFNILRPVGIYGAGSYLEIPTYRRIMRRGWSIELTGGLILNPIHVSDFVGAIVAVMQAPSASGTVFNVAGERMIRNEDLAALIATTLGVPRRRFTVPSAVAAPVAHFAMPLLGLIGRPKPLLADYSKGQMFSLGVNDNAFRQRYPHVPIRSLRDGLREHVAWAREQGLL